MTGIRSPVDSPTERRNARTMDIDRLSTLDMLRLLNAEDATVAGAVAAALPELARAADLVVAALRAGRRLHYAGAGTSGRLAAMDADEFGPTFGLPPGRVVAHVADPPAGGARQDIEDDEAAGAVAGARVSAGDVFVGVAASGRTPFVAAALRAAKAGGAATVLVSSNPSAPLAAEVDVHVCADTGPEAVTGSTRLKAGTAQKLVLNALSTVAGVRLGRTWSNLMVGAVPTNGKLRGRLVGALAAATGQPEDACAAALADAGGDGPVALVCLLGGVPAERARVALAEAGGVIREALASVSGSTIDHTE